MSSDFVYCQSEIEGGERCETVIPLTGKWYAVYPDAVRMGLSGVNTCVAVFKYKEQAMRFGNSMWQDKWILKQIKL